MVVFVSVHIRLFPIVALSENPVPWDVEEQSEEETCWPLHCCSVSTHLPEP